MRGIVSLKFLNVTKSMCCYCGQVTLRCEQVYLSIDYKILDKI